MKIKEIVAQVFSFFVIMSVTQNNSEFAKKILCSVTATMKKME